MWKQRSREIFLDVGRAGLRSRRVRLWACAVLLVVVILGVQAVWQRYIDSFDLRISEKRLVRAVGLGHVETVRRLLRLP